MKMTLEELIKRQHKTEKAVHMIIVALRKSTLKKDVHIVNTELYKALREADLELPA